MPKRIAFSPWGSPQHVKTLADGILQVSTSTHGGIHLSPERLAQMPEDQRSTDGWYEEDCEAAFVYVRFMNEIGLSEKDRETVAKWCASFDSFAQIACNR